MAQSTGVILAIGGITMANQMIFHSQPVDWRVPIATGGAAMFFALAETAIGPEVPRAIAILALVAVIFTRTNPKVPAPAESAVTWWSTQAP